METITEFVESEAIANQLRIIDVDYMQVYFIAEPKPLDEFTDIRFWPR